MSEVDISNFKKVGKVVSQQDPFNVGVQLKVCSEIYLIDDMDIQNHCVKLFGEGEYKELIGVQAIGAVWKEDKNKFVSMQPFQSWTWDDVNDVWVPPVAKPNTIGNPTFVTSEGIEQDVYSNVPNWNESEQRWENLNREDNNNYYWNPSNNSWTLIE